jgi:hypothetical protein
VQLTLSPQAFQNFQKDAGTLPQCYQHLDNISMLAILSSKSGSAIFSDIFFLTTLFFILTTFSDIFQYFPRCCRYFYFQTLGDILPLPMFATLLCPHSICMLPCRVLRIVLGPLDLYKLYSSIPELFAFPVQYAHRMHLQDTLWFHLNHIPIDNMISIRYIFLKQ